MNGLVVDRVFVERGVSGSKPLGDRPHRMFRSALDALEVLGGLKQAGVSLHKWRHDRQRRLQWPKLSVTELANGSLRSSVTNVSMGATWAARRHSAGRPARQVISSPSP